MSFGNCLYIVCRLAEPGTFAYNPSLGLTATGRADEDGDEVADETGEEEDEELRWKDSGDLSSAAKTPKAIARDRSPESDHRGSESDSEPILSATLSSESELPGADDGGLPAAVRHSYANREHCHHRRRSRPLHHHSPLQSSCTDTAKCQFSESG